MDGSVDTLVLQSVSQFSENISIFQTSSKVIPQSGRFSNSHANLFQFNRKNSRNVPQNLEPRVDVGVVGVHQHCPGPTKCGENQEVSPGVLLDDCSVLIVIIFRGIGFSRCNLGELACVTSCIALGHSGGYCDSGFFGQDCKCNGEWETKLEISTSRITLNTMLIHGWTINLWHFLINWNHH